MANFISYAITTGTKTVTTIINIEELSTLIYDAETKIITATLNTG